MGFEFEDEFKNVGNDYMPPDPNGNDSEYSLVDIEDSDEEEI